MTQEQKAKAYDEAKYIMKEYIESGNAGVIAEKTIKRAFPELEESEDERIRKEIISFLKSPFVNEYIADERVTPWIAWLEAKGKQKLVDKVEPKFRVKYAGSEYNVLEVKDIAGVTFYGIEDEPNHIDYVLPDNCEIISEQKPTWSEEDNKHLERILKELENQRQRPSNRPYLEEIESDYNWLNSIKDRVQSKLEWSKEDKEMLTEIIIDLKALKNRDTGEAGKAAYQREIDWLESLRPQAQWKPSDEQIKVLEFFIPYVTKCSIVLEKSKGTLLSLLSDLKKLKG